MDGRSRFGELCTEEIQAIMDNAVSVTTKKMFGMRLFNGTYPYVKFPLKVAVAKILRTVEDYVTTRINDVYPEEVEHDPKCSMGGATNR